ncbi:MAG: hypothetical protein KA803_08865 [Rhodoferax sp.]|nr:hypothetical protein [Rhodoferax sp.]
MKNIILILSVAAAISACASPPRYAYVKEGVSDHQRTDALSECSYQIQLNKTPAAQQPELTKLCMQGKGFRLKQIN